MEKQRRQSPAFHRNGDAPGTDSALGLLSWTIRHRRVLTPGRLFDLVHHPYLVDLYNCTSERMVVCKAGQMGLSEYAVSYALHAADCRLATVLYVFPTDAHVSDFSSARIGPAIEASPYLAGIIVESNAEGGQRGADRVTLKRVRDRFLYLRGARVDPDGGAAQLKSIDADCLVLDEMDEMDPRAPAIARKRLGHSSIAEERTISTPTYAGRGIHAEWLESDQREWHVRCDRCGQWQPMSIQQVVLEWDALGRPVRWNGQSEGRAFIACHKCGGELDRLARGRWVAAYPERTVAGFHVTRLFSAMANLAGIVASLATTDETKRREAYNQDLGEPYTPRGGQLTEDVLDGCRRNYAHAPQPGEQIVMGVDVGRVLHAVVRGPADRETGETRQHWAGEVDSFEEVGRMMKRFNVRTAVVDALPETSKARELQASQPVGAVWLAYYTTQKIGTKRADPMQWVEAEGVVNLDRTRSLDDMLSAFVEGKATLPANAREVRDYYDHLCAPVRVLEDGPGGERVPRYVESGPDHLAHAENYCRVAAQAPRPPVRALPMRMGVGARRQ